MRYDFLKTPIFYLNGLLMTIATILAVISLNIGLGWKIFIVCFVLVVYSASQFFQLKKISDKTKAKIMSVMIKSVDLFKHLIPGQRLRSNIFFLHKRGKDRIFRIEHSYNMDGYSDVNIEIPENLGCTGEAWRTKNQVFGTHEKIFGRGEFKIPDEQLRKVPSDIKWICATPILNNMGEVIGVMNFDGDKELNPEQVEQIKRTTQIISEELKEIVSEL